MFIGGDTMPEVRVSIYPHFELSVNGKTSFVPMQEAARAMDSPMKHVQVGGIVRESDGAIRTITDEEKQELNRLTDEWGAMR